MKTKKLLFSALLFCGMVAFATVWARPDSSDNTVRMNIPSTKTVAIGMTGLQSGSVDIRIVDNGKMYAFTGSTNGFIGEFVREGDSFDIELSFNSVSPAFSSLTTSANFTLTQISTTKYRVTVSDDLMSVGEIGLHFGNF